MKIKKKRLMAILEKRDAQPGVMQLVDPDELLSLIKEVMKHRKFRKRLKPTLDQCEELKEYLDSENFHEDGVSKRYGYIGDEAVGNILGAKFIAKLNEKLK